MRSFDYELALKAFVIIIWLDFSCKVDEISPLYTFDQVFQCNILLLRPLLIINTIYGNKRNAAGTRLYLVDH